MTAELGERVAALEARQDNTDKCITEVKASIEKLDDTTAKGFKELSKKIGNNHAPAPYVCEDGHNCPPPGDAPAAAPAPDDKIETAYELAWRIVERFGLPGLMLILLLLLSYDKLAAIFGGLI